MAILTSGERKRLETYLRPEKQAELRRRIDEYMLSIGARSVDAGMPRGSSRRADPTAMQALRSADPPPHIKQDIAWLETVRETKARFSNTPIVMLMRTYYERGHGSIRTCAQLHIERSTFYTWQSELLATMGIIAASKGIFGLEAHQKKSRTF